MSDPAAVQDPSGTPDPTPDGAPPAVPAAVPGVDGHAIDTDVRHRVAAPAGILNGGSDRHGNFRSGLRSDRDEATLTSGEGLGVTTGVRKVDCHTKGCRWIGHHTLHGTSRDPGRAPPCHRARPGRHPRARPGAVSAAPGAPGDPVTPLEPSGEQRPCPVTMTAAAA